MTMMTIISKKKKKRNNDFSIKIRHPEQFSLALVTQIDQNCNFLLEKLHIESHRLKNESISDPSKPTLNKPILPRGREALTLF